MITYKKAKCFYLGLNKWKIEYLGIIFELILPGGIRELMDHIDHWRPWI